MPVRPKIRLFVDQPLGEGERVALSRDHANYLFNVMRLREGAELALFNGVAGEWRAEVVAAGKRAGEAVCVEQVANQRDPPDLWLLFAPIKKTRTDFIVEKAVELGVRRIVPVQTEFTNAERIRQDRLQAHAVEAAEQCGAVFVPEVAELRPLAKVLDEWSERALVFADEGASGLSSRLSAVLTEAAPPAAVLVGPEGGFSDAERARLRGMEQVVPVGLGPRILRADTAAVSVLTLWQASAGDWG
ncbi:16S rRNA (uracil(1498)-N(3))-methyltransferase [Gymnodinialimonas hymeniacidonis]|uniref:16S rRNA (uracil(1498)-N(3))-methyltransferase n=1 Tax=Gymnodinialimonas hymeniacidonis TaxID=3126508 RepID=UPI0034C63F11